MFRGQRSKWYIFYGLFSTVIPAVFFKWKDRCQSFLQPDKDPVRYLYGLPIINLNRQFVLNHNRQRKRIVKHICVYCGSSPGKKPEFKAASRELAKELVKRGIGLVYGGSSVGIMGEIADAVLEGNGTVQGIIPKALEKRELSHKGLTKLTVVKSMHERKSAMADASDGFIALPGGLGTLEELFEIMTWAQLGFHKKPCALLNVDGYYDHLCRFLDKSVEMGFVKPIHLKMLIVGNAPADLLDKMAAYVPPVVDKWIGRDDT